MRQAIQIVSFVMENSILQVKKRLGKSYADMFVVLREMLHDPMLIAAIQEQIEEQHLDAASSVTAAVESFYLRLSQSPSPFVRERAADLLDLKTNLLDALDSKDCQNVDSDYPDSTKNSDAVAIVETLTPRLVLDLKNTHVRGLACEHAGPTSHAAILCRAFGLPAVAGIKSIHKQLPKEGYAIVDGGNGMIGIAGQRRELSVFRGKGHRPRATDEKSFNLSNITLMANIDLSEDVINALSAGAQGIGLYRTEFEFMANNRLLTKQEQFIRYRTVVIAMMGLPVTIRLMDIAVDKWAGIFDLSGHPIDSSYYGALFLLSRPDLLEMQACAISEASLFGPVRVLYPMVADAKQFMELKRLFRNSVDAKCMERLQHGVMIEQPSAVDDAQEIVIVSDFVCLGTNDLTKHILHIDRETAIAHGAEIFHAPQLWDAIGRVAAATSDGGKELTVCGEMASNLNLLSRFTDLGIRTFSMNIHRIRYLKKGNRNNHL
jgi:phosphoenolpyruvate-protein phosphotransferase (PTS system enzyme I)